MDGNRKAKLADARLAASRALLREADLAGAETQALSAAALIENARLEAVRDDAQLWLITAAFGACAAHARRPLWDFLCGLYPGHDLPQDAWELLGLIARHKVEIAVDDRGQVVLVGPEDLQTGRGDA